MCNTHTLRSLLACYRQHIRLDCVGLSSSEPNDKSLSIHMYLYGAAKHIISSYKIVCSLSAYYLHSVRLVVFHYSNTHHNIYIWMVYIDSTATDASTIDDDLFVCQAYGIGSTTVILLLLFYYYRWTFPIKYLRPSLPPSLTLSHTQCRPLSLFRPALFHVIYLLNMFHFSIREWKAHTECGGKRFDYGQTIIAIAAKHCVNGFLYTQKMFDKRKRECGCCWRGSVLSNNALRYISASRYDIENEFGMFFHAWKLLWSIRLNFNIHTHTSSDIPCVNVLLHSIENCV